MDGPGSVGIIWPKLFCRARLIFNEVVSALKIVNFSQKDLLLGLRPINVPFRNLFFKVQVDVKSSGRRRVEQQETSLVVLKIGLEQKVSIRFPFFLFSLLSLEHSIRRKFFTFSSRK